MPLPIVWRPRRWALGFGLLVMLATSLPYLAGFSAQGENWRFTGFGLAVEDGNSYLAKMRTGAEGAWLFRSSYTTMPQRGVLGSFAYLVLGKLTAPPAQHEQLVALFHLFRFGAGLLAILAMDDFLGFFISNERLRRWALALATCGGGLGWLLVLTGRDSWLGSLPLDFYSPETFGFLALYALPHLALARALLLWSLLAYLKPSTASPQIGWTTVRAESRMGLQVGGLWLLVGLLNPITLLAAWGVAAAHAGTLALQAAWARWRGTAPAAAAWPVYTARAAWAALLTLPLVGYTSLAFSSDPFLRGWTAQNLITSPHPLHYLVAYGAVAPFAVVGARRLLRRDFATGWLPVVWVALLPVLAYAPFNVQRRLPEAVWVALLGLAFQPGPRPAARGPYAALALFSSTVLLLFLGFTAALRPQTPVFRPAAEVQAFEYLEAHAPPGAVVLAAYQTGNPLPAFAPVRVVVGLGPETVGLAGLLPQVEAFYRPETPAAWREDFLRSQHVAYVFWGPNERALGSWNPAEAAYLRPVYVGGGYMIFEMSRISPFMLQHLSLPRPAARKYFQPWHGGSRLFLFVHPKRFFWTYNQLSRNYSGYRLSSYIIPMFLAHGKGHLQNP